MNVQTAIRDRLLGRPETPYSYRGEEWDAQLKTLPPACQLWRRFRAYDEARTAYETALAKRQRWSAELDAADALVRDDDPDSGDEEFNRQYLRAQRLRFALKNGEEHIRELKARQVRAGDAWGRAWGEYKELGVSLWHARQGIAQIIPGTLDMHDDTVQGIEFRRRQYEIG